MNRLQHEKSPYLLQHKNNPVDWYPWGDEAFETAKKLNKPIFLSIGYATCHWCHVMEHESFEDHDIAKLLNDAFINIKVDREERPDIDNTYMTVCQMVTGHGGWPLNVILTPDKEPFYAGTYIPKEAKFQRIGLRQLIPGIAGMWKHEPEKVKKAVESIKEGFNKSLEFEKGLFPGLEAVNYAAEQLASRFDATHGGFDSAPKFPSPHNLTFLLRQWYATQDERFKNMVETTLLKMRLGGLWDHVGFGFHRYSTDEKWLLPHFEKMLYDQALLMIAYTEGWQVTKNELFKQTVYEIAEYVATSLSLENGGFYSAQDADSEGEEGKFYIWNTEKLNNLSPEISNEEITFFKNRFNFKDEGNFKDEATKQLTGNNIPYLKTPLNSGDQNTFNKIRPLIYNIRSNEIPPITDDKILTDWNMLMITALAKAGAVFGDDELLLKAKNAYSFIKKHLIINKQLMHRYKDGEASINAFADDYAFAIQASLQLYESTFDSSYLYDAIEFTDVLIAEFNDDEQGGFYFTSSSSEKLLGRQKQIYDGAIPSSNSVSIMNFMKLHRITGNTLYEDQANKIGEAFSTDLIRSGSSITYGLQSIQFINYQPKELVMVTSNEIKDSTLNEIHELFAPFTVLIAKNTESNNLDEVIPYTATMTMIDNKPTFYLCTNQSCDKPTNDVSHILNSLKSQPFS